MQGKKCESSKKKEKRIHMLFVSDYTHTQIQIIKRGDISLNSFFFRIYIYMCTHIYEDTVAFLFD